MDGDRYVRPLPSSNDRSLGAWCSQILFCLQDVRSSASPVQTHTYSLCSNPSSIVRRACWDTTTSNLNNHILGCNRAVQKRVEGASQGSQIAGSTYTPERLRALIDIWLASSLRPFAIVDDAGFQEILRMFDPHILIPSQPTISRDVREMYVIARENLASFLEVSAVLDFVELCG